MIRNNLLSVGSTMVGMVSLFLSGMFALGIACLAILGSFLAARRKEKCSTVGMLVGAVVLIFVNLQNIGILKSEAKIEIEAVYSSLRLSNQAFVMLGDENLGKMVAVLGRALDKARKVDTELVDRLVPGFRNHFEQEYIEGFVLFKEGNTDSDIGKKLKGAILVDLWAIWSRENKEKLEKARQQQPSLVAFIF